MSMQTGCVRCKSRLLALAALGLWLADGTAVRAANVPWINTTPGGATWHSDANWNPAQPTPADTAVITNGYKAIVTSDVTITNIQLQSGSTLRIESGTLRITDPVADVIRIGDSGKTGSVEQAGGSLEFAGSQATHWGYDAGARGSLTMQGGAATLAKPIFGRFAGGSGALTISGGNVLLNGGGGEMVVGYNGSGTLDLSGGGLIVTNGYLTVGRGGGQQPGYGALTVSGGDCTNYATLNVGVTTTGVAGPATGLVHQTAGTWLQRAVTTISGQTAEFTLSGGTFVQSNSAMRVGYNNSGNVYTGRVTIAGGTLDCNALWVGYGLGDGYLVMTNGVMLLGSAEIGRGGGGFPGRGTVTFSGGAITNSGTLTLGNSSGSTGMVFQSGGTWVQTGASTIGGNAGTVGSLTITGGVFQAAANVTVGTTGTGSLTVGGSGSVAITNVAGTALLDIKVGEFKLMSGTATVSRVVNASTGALTLQGGRLKVLGSITNNAAGPWVIGDGTQVAVLELATAATVTNRVTGGLVLTNNAFLATSSGKLGTNVTVVGTGGLEWTAVADTNASPGVALAGSGAVLAFGAGAAPVLRLTNPQELEPAEVIGKTYTLMTWTGDAPATEPAWTIDYGDTGFRGGEVRYDLPGNRLQLRGFHGGTGTVISIE